MTISERVKKAADREGSVPALAKRVKVGRQTLYDIAQGHVPSGRTLLKLLAAGVIKHSDLQHLDAA